MNLLDLKSEIWETLPGYYEGLKDNLELLVQDEPSGEAYEWQEVTLLLIGLELQEQTKFYEVTYAVLPYYVTALEKRFQERDVRSQLGLIIDAGKLIQPQISKEHSNMIQDAELIRSYEESVVRLQELAKDFWKVNQGYLKLQEKEKKIEYCIAMIAIMGDGMLAGILENNLLADDFCLVCDACEYCLEQPQQAEKVTLEKIVPIETAIGKWDGQDFSKTYVWLSNLADLLGITYIKNYLPYYFGSYTCSECGKVSSVMDLCKRDWRQYVRFVEEQEETVDIDNSSKEDTASNFQEDCNFTKESGTAFCYCMTPHYSVEWFATALYSMWLFGAILVLVSLLDILSETTGGTNKVLGGVVACVFWLLVVIVTTVSLRRKEDVSSYYYWDTIYVKRFGHKSVEFTYSELADCITKKKIYIKDGIVGIPYEGGRIPVFLWNGEEAKGFFEFLGKKCRIELPGMSANKIEAIRKTRFGWGWMNGVVKPLLWISVGFYIAMRVALNGINVTWNELPPLCLGVKNMCGMGILLALGVTMWVKISHFLAAKKQFKAYEKIIKVKLW